MQLTPQRRDALTEIFRKYDSDADGFLGLPEFQLFGWAVSGRKRVPTPEEAWQQLSRADSGRDGVVSLDEFLAFSTRLARMPDEPFVALIAHLDAAHAEASRFGIENVLARAATTMQQQGQGQGQGYGSGGAGSDPALMGTPGMGTGSVSSVPGTAATQSFYSQRA
jgi:hypothetical protein